MLNFPKNTLILLFTLNQFNIHLENQTAYTVIHNIPQLTEAVSSLKVYSVWEVILDYVESLVLDMNRAEDKGDGRHHNITTISVVSSMVVE